MKTAVVYVSVRGGKTREVAEAEIIRSGVGPALYPGVLDGFQCGSVQPPCRQTNSVFQRANCLTDIQSVSLVRTCSDPRRIAAALAKSLFNT